MSASQACASRLRRRRRGHRCSPPAARQQQRAELAQARGPARAEDLQPLHRRSSASRSSSGSCVLGATVVFAVQFRYREGKNDNPKQIHGNTPLEIGWTIVPALILAVVAVPTIITIFDLAKEPTGPDVLQVNVVGKQWWWQFKYPKRRRSSPPTSCIIPARRASTRAPVRRRCTLPSTCNVIHGFWVPGAHGKKDVVPGPDDTSRHRGRQARHLPRAVRGVLRALARRTCGSV